MDVCRYAVIRVQGAWWIDGAGRSFGPHPSQEAAVDFARSAASSLGPEGQRLEVWARDDSGRPVLQWCGGRG